MSNLPRRFAVVFPIAIAFAAQACAGSLSPAEQADIAAVAAFQESDPPKTRYSAEAVFTSRARGDRVEAENAVIAILDKCASPYARDVALTLLARFGGKTSVPVLEKACGDEMAGTFVASGLAAMNVREGSSALARVADKGAGAAQIQALNALSLETRATTDFVPALARIAGENTPAAAAAKEALARLGSVVAIRALTALKPPANDALLSACDRNLASRWANKPVVAEAVKGLVADTTAGATQRTRAARLLLAAAGDAATPQVLPLLKDEDPLVRRLVVAPLVARSDARAVEALVEAVVAGDKRVATLAFEVARDNPSPRLVPLITAGLASTDADVLAAAGAAALSADNGASAGALTRHLAENGAVKQAVKGLLSGFDAPKVTGALLASLASAPTVEVKLGILEVLGERRDRDAFNPVLNLTKADDAKVRAGAFGTLATLAGAGDLRAVIGAGDNMKKSADRREWQKALFAAAKNHPSAAEAATLLSSAHAAKPAETVPIIGALSALTGKEAEDALRAMLTNSDIEIRKAVIRALASARGPSAITLLIEAAKAAKDTGERILAMRGHLESVAASGLSPADRVVKYRAAWPVADAEEKETIVAALKALTGTEAPALLKELGR